MSLGLPLLPLPFKNNPSIVLFGNREKDSSLPFPAQCPLGNLSGLGLGNLALLGAQTGGPCAEWPQAAAPIQQWFLALLTLKPSFCCPQLASGCPAPFFSPLASLYACVLAGGA